MAKREKVPHLLLPLHPEPSRFVSPRTPFSDIPPARNRAIHAELLKRQLAAVEAGITARAVAHTAQPVPAAGTYVEFVGEAGYALRLASLDARSQGIEVVAVREDTTSESQQSQQRATVFVPHGKLSYFVDKVHEYETQDTPQRRADAAARPRNERLIANIAAINLAVVESLWTDEPHLFPPLGHSAWWEVWLRGDGPGVRDRYAAAVSQFGIQVGEQLLAFPERTVVLARATREQISTSVEALDQIAELRLAKVSAYEFLQLDRAAQGEWVQDLRTRVLAPSDQAPAICILDTGVNRGHPLLVHGLADSDCQAVNPEWGKSDHHGHGTKMAGLALYGDLADVMLQSGDFPLTHVLESVKILSPFAPTHPDLYGAVTASGIARAEVEAPNRQRVICMAVTATDTRDQGQPSSWSAELDKLASGYDNDDRRLVLVSAGNTDPKDRHLYPDSNFTDGIHDPGQAWNAITVGAYTNKVTIKEPDAVRGWKPVAAAGALSPTSTTAVSWPREWANKPDIVMEGGNLGLDPFTGKAYMMDSLSLLTTGASYGPPNPEPLVPMSETSAAVALASRMAAQIQSAYPTLWPEAIRGLLVHSADWTKSMAPGPLRTSAQKLALLRSSGFGVPSLERALWSASNSLTMVVQDQLQPFQRRAMRDYKVYKFPWPVAELLQLFHTQVELRVSLSYFVEPNPARRGWRDRYRYQSHGLRFEVIRATEDLNAFRQRVNQAERDDQGDRSRDRDSDGWVLGPQIREHGSVHCDSWFGSAADLARRDSIAVFPVGGWWREQLKLERSERPARFALVVSLRTPPTDIDIYTPVETQLQVPVQTGIA